MQKVDKIHKCPDGNQSLLWYSSVIHPMQVHAEHAQHRNKTLTDLRCGKDCCCRLSNTVCLDAAAKEGAWMSLICVLLPTLEMGEGPFCSPALQPSKINLFPITTSQECSYPCCWKGRTHCSKGVVEAG